MLEVVSIEFQVDGFELVTPLFKLEDSCLLYISKSYPDACKLKTITSNVFDDYRNYEHYNRNNS